MAFHTLLIVSVSLNFTEHYVMDKVLPAVRLDNFEEIEQGDNGKQAKRTS